MALSPEPDVAHPRAARAMRYRDGVRAWRTDGGVVLVGQRPFDLGIYSYALRLGYSPEWPWGPLAYSAVPR